MKEIETNYSIRNVKKALELIEKLAESKEPLSLPELADSVSFSRNRTFRLIETLIEKGLVERDSASSSYRLGAGTVALGKKLAGTANLDSYTKKELRMPSDGSHIVSYAHPILEELARRHEEAVYMTVIKDNEVLFLNMVDCPRQIKAEPMIGRKFPFFTNAAGKVIKAVDSWDLLERLCRRDAGRGKQPDLETLASELQEIRATGVAVDNGGLGEGIVSVAVAVRDYAGKVVGAITLLAPSFRMLATRLESEIIPSMREGALILSRKFGYAP